MPRTIKQKIIIDYEIDKQALELAKSQVAERHNFTPDGGKEGSEQARIQENDLQAENLIGLQAEKNSLMESETDIQDKIAANNEKREKKEKLKISLRAKLLKSLNLEEGATQEQIRAAKEEVRLNGKKNKTQKEIVDTFNQYASKIGRAHV